MKRNRVSVAMLAALSVCGVVHNTAHAQGGVLMPEPATAPAVKVVPNVREYPAKKVERTEAPMPVPHASSPMKATGRIVHVQNLKNIKSVFPTTPPAVTTPINIAPMSMGGFVTVRPPMEMPSVNSSVSVEPKTAVPSN